MDPAPIAQRSAADVAAALRAPEAPFLLDVREAEELQIAHVEGAHWIPMGEVSARLEELPKEKPIVVMCHHGIRSLRIAQYLQWAGFDRVENLRGGIDAWSMEVDPEIQRY